jgi:dTDP-4-dehydrorhamnose 3,5-epimerase
MQGVMLTPLKIIEREPGNIMHGMKQGDAGYEGFGEAYFTFVNYKTIKGWKKHSRMTLNLIVPLGAVKFVIFDDRENSSTRGQFFETILSRQNYQRLSVAPGLWTAFQGIDKNENMVLNIGSIHHDPTETEDSQIDNPQLQYGNWI